MRHWHLNRPSRWKRWRRTAARLSGLRATRRHCRIWRRPPNREQGAIDIQLEVRLETESMRRSGADSARLSATSYRHAYWTVSQLLAHHTVNGCNLQPGDLFGSGTFTPPRRVDAISNSRRPTVVCRQTDCS